MQFFLSMTFLVFMVKQYLFVLQFFLIVKPAKVHWIHFEFPLIIDYEFFLNFFPKLQFPFNFPILIKYFPKFILIKYFLVLNQLINFPLFLYLNFLLIILLYLNFLNFIPPKLLIKFITSIIHFNFLFKSNLIKLSNLHLIIFLIHFNFIRIH